MRGGFQGADALRQGRSLVPLARQDTIPTMTTHSLPHTDTPTAHLADHLPPSGPIRPRRLRLNAGLRALVRETRLSPDNFIYPLFVTHGRGLRSEIASMPGVYQWSPDLLGREAEEIAGLGLKAVLLFGL